MATTFRILAATDGSAPAQAAIAVALAFPWPEPSTARGVVALAPAVSRARGALRAAEMRALSAVVEPTRRTLARRWSDAEVVALDQSAKAAVILDEAGRFGADAIVVGWRGHGTVRRLLAGSVSRAVVQRADCSVLVARAAPRAVRRLVVGFDASPGGRQTMRFLSRLPCPRGGVAVLVHVIEPIRFPPAARRLPASTRAAVRAAVDDVNREGAAKARRKADAAAALLERAGWRTKVEIRFGVPLDVLLKVTTQRKGDILIVGARSTAGVERVLLGSVADGVLNHSPTPVLIVRDK
jgi:nucleotide-binding universal stress UspA family protein